jgi:geranylgeranyl reductase family protein
MYDVIIVGGGPAGSSAGRLAGRKCLKTLLIEKESFPRYKPCGGALSEQALSYLGFEIPAHIIEKNIFGARVHFQKQVIEEHKKYRIAALVTRSVFDNYLLDKSKESGIEVKMNEKVIDCIEKPDHVHVVTSKDEYKSKFAVIAEGSHGRLKYQIREKDRKDEFAISFVAEIPADNKEIDKYIFNAIDIYFGVTNMGYGWIFPHNGYYSASIGGLAKDLKNPRELMDDFLKSNGFTGKYTVKSHIIPFGGIKRKTIGSRTILTGDAAGYVDSFYGEGISYAIRSGQIAIEVIHKAITDNADSKALAEYEKICKEEFGSNLKYSLILSKLMHSFPQIFFKVFTRHNEVLGKYLEVPAFKRTYKSYIKWLVPRIPKYLLS